MQTAHYGTLVIRPRSMQFAIDELPLLLLCLAGYGCAGIENLIGSGMLLRVSVLCSLYLLYRSIYLRRTEYLLSLGEDALSPEKIKETARLVGEFQVE